jgi:hypothetical protein
MIFLVSVYLFTGHAFPISDIYWRPDDEIMIVRSLCPEGTIYVWQVRFLFVFFRLFNINIIFLLNYFSCEQVI